MTTTTTAPAASSQHIPEDDLYNIPAPVATPISTQDLSSLHTLLDPSSSSLLLRGRHVLIPVGTKAFVAGTLDPPTRRRRRRRKHASCSTIEHNNSKNNNEEGADDEEMVTMNLGQGYLADMSREQASHYIGRRLEALLAPSGSTAVVGTTTHGPKTSSSVLTPPNNSQHVGDGKSNTSTENDVAAATPAAAAAATRRTAANELPFFEIREEFDEFGNEIRSEAVNVAEELKHLQAASERTNNNTNDDDDVLGDLVRNVSVPPPDDTTTTAVAVVAKHDTTTSRTSSSSEQDKFEAVLSRLDELLLLDESTEREREINVRSSKRLQSKGWAKGFLNNKEKQPTKKNINPVIVNAEAVLVSHNNNNKNKNNNKSVTIREDKNETKHIPKIGRRDLPFQQKKRESTSSRPPSSGEKPSPQPFEKEAFSGVVAEKKKTGIRRNNSSSSTATTQQQAPPKKKLSRFAQERQQRGFQ